MESDMVNENSNSWAESLNLIVINFFKENLPHFRLLKETKYGPYWGVHLTNDYGLETKIGGDIAFNIIIKIDDIEYPLWKFDRSVIDRVDTSNENILFQLVILNSLLK